MLSSFFGTGVPYLIISEATIYAIATLHEDYGPSLVLLWVSTYFT